MSKRKLSLLGVTALLVTGGVGMGALASGLTTATLKWTPPSPSMAPAPDQPGVDQGEAGRSWARMAYDGGLRRCPELNPIFTTACTAEMKALASRPAFQPGSYGGPLLVAQVDYAASAPSRPVEPPPLEPEAEAPETFLEPLPDATPADYPALAGETAADTDAP